MSDEPIRLDRQGNVFLMSMSAGENRWNTSFTRAFDAALDDVAASDGPAALVTASENAKFFSNGLDLEWITSQGEHPGGDREVFNAEIMSMFAKLMTLPVPTVCAVNGHAFGAGLMTALCHDVRVMQRDRGYLCANELELGFAIPAPELALFRHKVPTPAFYETVQLARRWSGPDALAAGMVQALAEAEDLLELAIERAASLAHLAANREVFGWMKEAIFGENSALQGDHGAAYLLRNQYKYPSAPGSVPSAPTRKGSS